MTRNENLLKEMEELLALRVVHKDVRAKLTR